MKTAVLVMSHDKYASAWEPFMHGFNKYWPDCPYPLFFMMHKQIPPSKNIVLVGEDKGWGNSMKIALNQLKQNNFEYVIVACEDYWFTGITNTKMIKFFIEDMNHYFLNHIRLIPSSEAGDYFKHIDYEYRLRHFKKDAVYKTSMNMGIWNIDCLNSLIKETDTIWSFETEGGTRIEDDKSFLAVDTWDYIHYVHPNDPYFNWAGGAIEAGQYKQSAYDYAKKEGIKLCNL